MNMNKLTHKLKELGGRRIVFSIVVLAYLLWLIIINALMFLPALGLLPDNALSAMEHFGDFTSTGDTHNLIHELVFAFIIGTAAVGLLFQLWKPLQNIAGQLIALIIWAVMILLAIITSNWVPQPLYITFGGLTILATILHPSGLGLFNWFSVAKLNRVLLALVIIAAVPLTVFAFANINLQLGGAGGVGTGFSGLFGHQKPTHDGADSIMPADIEAVKQKYGNYTVAQAEQEGYVLDSFCLNAESFGQQAELGAMGYHAINEDLLMGPIAVERPQAFMFDAEGRVLGVEYEIMADMVSEPPQLFGQTFTKLPPHPGVEHEHYALHVWFVDNPNGQFANFNPNVSCPPGSAPSAYAGGMTIDNEADHDQEHVALGHYRSMAALSFIIILVGLLASLRPSGWRLAAWVAGVLPILLGLASVVLPAAESSLGIAWGLAAITWGLAFIVVAEVVRRKELKTTQEL